MFIRKFTFTAASAVALQIAIPAAWAQSSCSSDGQRKPTALIERFISAECETCWAGTQTVKPKPLEVALDWIVPSPKGDEAPLSAAASNDALFRLQALNQPTAPGSLNLRRAVSKNPLLLRVARGVALGGYMGASIELMPRRDGRLPNHPMTVWLVMIEDIPAGTDGTPVNRELVRNSLQINWNEPGVSAAPLPNAAGQRLYESRPMSIPAGANPDRLNVVGWVEDSKGQVIASARSVCVK